MGNYDETPEADAAADQVAELMYQKALLDEFPNEPGFVAMRVVTDFAHTNAAASLMLGLSLDSEEPEMAFCALAAMTFGAEHPELVKQTDAWMRENGHVLVAASLTMGRAIARITKAHMEAEGGEVTSAEPAPLDQKMWSW